MNKMYDILIVGGGPAGLSSLIYAVRGGIEALLIEDNPYGCGQISLTEQVDNYPGLNGINGFDLGDRFIEHATSLGGNIKKGKVVKIAKEDDHFITETDKGDVYESKTLIYALGTHHRLLNIEGEEKFKGHGVSYCATCDATFFKDKTVAVVGGGDTALSDAFVLSKLSKKVYVIHRRDVFRASKSLVDKCALKDNIEFVFNTVPLRIEGDKSVKRIVTSTLTLDASGVFVAVGEIPNSMLLEGLADLDNSSHVITNKDMETKTPGLFVVGDVRSKRLRQVVTAVSDGAIASTYAIEKYC